MKKVMLILVLGLVGGITLACKPTPTGTPPVMQMMPDLPGYDVIEGQEIQAYIAGLAEGAALLAGQPQLAILVEKVDSAIACYRDVGAADARIYTDKAFPLSAGAVAIADRNRLLDPNTLFRCIGGGIIPFSAQPELNPCSHTYTLERDDNEFYIVYAGTTLEICTAFCTNLEGCKAH